MMIEVVGKEEFDALRDKDARIHWFVESESLVYMVGQEKHTSPEREITVSLTTLVRELRTETFEIHILKTRIYVGSAFVGSDEYKAKMEEAGKFVKERWPFATYGRWE